MHMRGRRERGTDEGRPRDREQQRGCGFLHNDGTCVSASTVCNSLIDCGDGEHEDPARCDVPRGVLHRDDGLRVGARADMLLPGSAGLRRGSERRMLRGLIRTPQRTLPHRQARVFLYRRQTHRSAPAKARKAIQKMRKNMNAWILVLGTAAACACNTPSRGQSIENDPILDQQAKLLCEFRVLRATPDSELCVLHEIVGFDEVKIEPTVSEGEPPYYEVTLAKDRCSTVTFFHATGDALRPPPPPQRAFPRFPYVRYPMTSLAATTTASFYPSSDASYAYDLWPQVPTCPLRITVKPVL